MTDKRRGDLIVCANGHVIGEVLRDVGPSDPQWGDAFGNWRQPDVPTPGSMHKPVCAQCGASFFKEGSWEPLTRPDDLDDVASPENSLP